MKPLVIYHADCADGFGAAFATWLKLGDGAEYVPMQYGQGRTPDVKNRDVYIMDFSFSRETMDRLFQHAKRVVWLDHHKTSFELLYGAFIGRVNGEKELEVGLHHHVVLDNTKSGALLAWEHFHPGIGPPMLFDYIDDHDRWQHKLPGSREFNAALWSYAPWSFEQWRAQFMPADMSNYWTPTSVRAAFYLELIEEGKSIARAVNQVVEKMAERASKCIILGVEGLAVNAPIHHSEIGDLLALRSGTFGMIWHTEADGSVKCSLRSRSDFDVSMIAVALNGGGHRNAAAFRTRIGNVLSWMDAGQQDKLDSKMAPITKERS